MNIGGALKLLAESLQVYTRTDTFQSSVMRSIDIQYMMLAGFLLSLLTLGSATALKVM